MPLQAAIDAMRGTRAFAQTSAETLRQALTGVERVERVTVKAETVLVEAGVPWKYYWLLIEGETRAERPESNGTWTLVGNAVAGGGFGESAFLSGTSISKFRIVATLDSELLRFERARWCWRTWRCGCSPTKWRRCIGRNWFLWERWLRV